MTTGLRDMGYKLRGVNYGLWVRRVIGSRVIASTEPHNNGQYLSVTLQMGGAEPPQSSHSQPRSRLVT